MGKVDMYIVGLNEVKSEQPTTELMKSKWHQH